jgi:hypothetical protein
MTLSYRWEGNKDRDVVNSGHISFESHLINDIPAVRYPHSMTVQRLEDIMELIQVGRFGPAIIKMSSHWN